MLKMLNCRESNGVGGWGVAGTVLVVIIISGKNGNFPVLSVLEEEERNTVAANVLLI